jgi:hypothetical protein
MGTAGIIFGLFVFTVFITLVGMGVYFYVKDYNLPVNVACTHNNQCKNGACGLPSAGATQHICCPSGKIDTYAATDYCTGMPDGTACWSDAMCANGLCIGNNGGLTKGVCGGQQPASSKCVHNDQCAGKACGLPSAGAADHICCPSGKTDTFAGNDYCTGMPDGTACWTDAMCANGLCSGNAGGVQKGICSGNKPANAGCDHNDQCANGACGLPYAGATQHICCASGKIDTFAANDYCTGMANGTACWTDAMCANGVCSGNAGGTQKGVCSGNAPPSASCVHNNQCSNGACGYPYAGASQHICCPSGKIDTFAGNDYCTEMPAGNECWTDAMCASKDCKGNAYGLQKGKCT